MKLRLAINGFGRIGRSFVKAALKDREFMNLIDIVAINDLTDAKTLAHLFKYDSVFGKFDRTVEIDDDNSTLVINGFLLKVISEKDPSRLPWKDLNIDIVLESSGIFNDAKDAKKHIEAGAKKVIISAPAKQPDATILMDVNNKLYDNNKHRIVSMASCTTNCLAPVIKVINDKFGIENCYMTTTHAYTNDQRILDLPHKEINKALKDASEEELKGIMEYTEEPLVSSDIIGNPHSSIVDGLSTMVLANKSKTVKILSWYDNEWSFACRLIDLMKFVVANMIHA